MPASDASGAQDVLCQSAAPRVPDFGRGDVTSQQLLAGLGRQVHRALQAGVDARQQIVQPVDPARLIADQIATAGNEQPDLGIQLTGRLDRPQFAAMANLVGDDPRPADRSCARRRRLASRARLTASPGTCTTSKPASSSIAVSTLAMPPTTSTPTVNRPRSPNAASRCTNFGERGRGVVDTAAEHDLRRRGDRRPEPNGSPWRRPRRPRLPPMPLPPSTIADPRRSRSRRCLTER